MNNTTILIDLDHRRKDSEPSVSVSRDVMHSVNGVSYITVRIREHGIEYELGRLKQELSIPISNSSHKFEKLLEW